jgi:hypothetical protein
MYIRLIPCLHPRCDVVWLADSTGEDNEPIEAFWKRKIKDGDLATVCARCYRRVHLLAEKKLARGMLACFPSSQVDGPRGVGLEQPQAPSPPDLDENPPSWV